MKTYYIKREKCYGSDWYAVDTKTFLEHTGPCIVSESIEDTIQQISAIEGRRPFVVSTSCIEMDHWPYPVGSYTSGPTEEDFIDHTIIMSKSYLSEIKHDGATYYISEVHNYKNIVGTQNEAGIAVTYNKSLAAILHKKHNENKKRAKAKRIKSKLAADKRKLQSKEVTKSDLYKVTANLKKLIEKHELPRIKIHCWSFGLIGAYLMILLFEPKNNIIKEVVEACMPIIGRFDIINQDIKQSWEKQDKTTYSLLKKLKTQIN